MMIIIIIIIMIILIMDNINLEYLDPDLEVPPFNRKITKSLTISFYNAYTTLNSYFSCDISLPFL